MRIAFLSDGGIGKYIVTQRALMLGRYWVRDGHEVYIFLVGESEDRERYGQEMYGIHLHYTWASSQARTVIPKFRAMMAFNFDLVHCLKPSWSFIAGVLYKLTRQCTCLIVDHDELESQVVSPRNRSIVRVLERLSLWTADGTIVASSFLAERFSRSLPDRGLLYLPYAADLELYESQRHRFARYRRGNKVILTYLGYLLPRYNQDRVIEALALLARKRDDFLAYIVGDGPMRETLMQTAEERGLSDQIEFLGFVPHDEVPAILEASDVLLFPIEKNLINQARCPNKVFEYVCANRPIVTNRVGEVERALGDQGIYFDYESIVDFKDKIEVAIHSRDRRYSHDFIQSHGWEARYHIYKSFVISLIQA
jgi:glycosyltransferase involved in cell wall biosynthesis